MKDESEVREMADKFTQARTSNEGGELDPAQAEGIEDALRWVLDDGSRDDYDLEQYLPDEEGDDT